MEAKKLLEILSVAEQLKCRTRHCDTSSGRRESVAEHSWRVALMAMLMEDEFPELDIDKVIRMCLIHDLGEAFTGDIPAFLKKSEDGEKEEAILERWVGDFPAPYNEEWLALLREMKQKGNIPVLTKSAHGAALERAAKRQFELACRAENLWGLCLTRPLDAGWSFRSGPVILK